MEKLIWLVFIVKFLSVQMTVVHPRVSTDVSDLTIAFLAAIFFVPSARHVVTTAGRPSGIAATVIVTEYYTRVMVVRKWLIHQSWSRALKLGLLIHLYNELKKECFSTPD